MTTQKKKKPDPKWKDLEETESLNSFAIDSKDAQSIEVKIGKLAVRCEAGRLRKEFVCRGRWKFAWDVEAYSPRVNVPRYVFCGDAPTFEAAKRCADVAVAAMDVMEEDVCVPPEGKKR